MKVVICAIAKCENNYINDWVNYHLDLGVDEIYLYDNNDPSYEPVESRIQRKNKVHIIKIPGARGFQSKKYTEFYNEHKNDFDWIIFIDIDEFIVLQNWKNIKEFLADPKFNGYPVVRLNWHLYGDDNKTSRDMSIPIYKGITKRLTEHRYGSQAKEIIRGGLNNVVIPSSHFCRINGKLPKQVMPDGKPTDCEVKGLRNCNEAYINHYMTKTLKEFIDQKMQRSTDAGFPDRVIDLEYFWNINPKTPEKEKFAKEYINSLKK